MGRFATQGGGKVFRCLTNVWESGPSFTLEVFEGGVIFGSCRFTNFIVNNAGRTVRSWSVPAIGRARNARNAAQRRSIRNSRCSLRREPRARRSLKNAVEAAAGAAAVTDIQVGSPTISPRSRPRFGSGPARPNRVGGVLILPASRPQWQPQGPLP